MMKHDAQLKGFVIKELLITFGVIIGLFAIAFPAYRDYMQRNYYKDIVEATAPFKIAVAKCFKKLKTFTGCNAGSHSIPSAINKPKGALAGMNVTNGVITAVPVARDGISATDIYVLTPKMVNDELVWVSSGNGLAHGLTG